MVVTIIWTIWCIILLVLILAIYKIFHEYKRYGKKIFIASRKPGEFSNSDLLAWIASEHKEYTKILKIDNGIILLTESGLYVLIYLSIDHVKFSGTIDDKEWEVTNSKGKEDKLKNPFFHYKGDNLQNILITRHNVICKIKGIKNIYLDRLLYVLVTNKKKLYDSEKIDTMYKDLKNRYKKQLK